MRLQRRPKVAAVPLEELPWHELTGLARAGLITWVEVRQVLHENVIRRFGYDPYQHLKEETPDDHQDQAR